MRSKLVLGLGALALAGTIAIVWSSRSDDDVEAEVEAAVDPPFSNVRREDYIGPAACESCHEERYAQWREHPHSRMNQDASTKSVVGDFSGVSVEYGGVTTVFETRDGSYFMAHHRDGELVRRDRITRTIGSRFQQAYVGVQVEGPEPADHTLYTTERALPFVWWFSRQQWFPEHFVEEYPQPEHQPDGSLSYPTDDPLSRGARPWSEGCMLCHNTYAYAYRSQREMPGTGFADIELADTEAGPSPQDLVTLGVSCEACHFGGRAHATIEAEARDIPTGPDVRSFTAPARTTNSICAQCHVAGTLPWPNGAASLNSSEARDMMGGACSSAIECTACHDPHVAGPRGEPYIEDRGPVGACVACHEKYAEDASRQVHARHSATDASCLDCHMPRITQGIEAVVRTHEISSPTDASMLAAGAPNACNLCHLDRSITWTIAALRDGWNARVETQPSWEDWYGDDLSDPVGEAWLSHPTPAVRLVAAAAYARSPLGRPALPSLLDLLIDDYPHVRMFALFAVESILGRRLAVHEYTPTAPHDHRLEQVDALRRALPR